ncbi:2-oxo-4-hydroxy-4-carboxy-5-ureidoimidazoline decarboxylase [Amphritea sp.]|uniref:2-oxo-4-hydroxy-4-carboxy-5-ureidoimidazoline decarboxylase n=1 Tax=Amphritea sp. TaxID=1872502 RepID=UPI003A90D6B9
MSSPQFKSCTPSQMSREAFVSTFGDVYEHSAWVAEQAYDLGLDSRYDQIETLHKRMAKILLDADKQSQLDLINAHPDLAGKAAIAGELTESSTSEQAGAGISECTAEEFTRFTALNDAYKTAFGFPFIMAVKGSNRHQILAAFEERIHNNPEQEFNRALQEINKIAQFRLDAI